MKHSTEVASGARPDGRGGCNALGSGGGSAAGGPGTVGLSTGHIGTRGALIGHQGGSLAQLKASGVGRYHSGKRDVISGFSRSSQRRLMQLLASINEHKTADHRAFVTLTYPAQYPACPKAWKAHLRAFMRRLQRHPAFQGAVWKMEHQKRGAPHFHLLTFTEMPLGHEWVARNWYEVVGSGRPEHLEAGTSCEPIRSWRGVKWYTAKYVAKSAALDVPDDVVELWRRSGRWWGRVGNLVIEPEAVEFEDERSYYAVRRVLRRWQSRQLGRKVRSWGHAGCSAFLAVETVRRLQAWAVDLGREADRELADEWERLERRYGPG